MRKLIPILVVSILVLSGLGAVAVSEKKVESIETEKIVFSEPKIIENGNYVRLSIEDTTDSLKTGKPIVPKITKVYTFPFGTKITDVQVTFSDPVEIQISKPLKPAPEPMVLSIEHSSDNVIQTQEIETYADIDVYPETQFSYKVGTGLDDGKRVVFLSLQAYPAQYFPQIDTIKYSKTVTFDFTAIEPETPITFGDDYDFLIITPSQFTSQLQPLVDYKNNDDVPTMMVTLDDIPNTGVDEQESIKYYIKDAIETYGVTYLLLVGAGVEESEIFPVRNAYIPSGNYEKYYPSDLYYADIYDGEGSFSSWDSDGDGKYAEVSGFSNDIEDMDMYPDVYLGKLPANNAAEVSAVVDKIIYYEEHNKMLNKILQIGGDTFPGDPENINEGEFANGKVLERLSGYNSVKLWASESGGADALTKQNIANGYKSGVDFVDFSGHGSYASWATHAPADDATWLPPKSIISPYTGWLYIDYDMYNVNNNFKFPVTVFNACSCNKYSESETCIAWKNIVEAGGGIASFGASGIGYGSYGTHEVERVWGWMEVHIFDNVYNKKILGVAWADSLNDYINSFIDDDWDDSDYKTITEMSMFGDPTLAIEDGKDPKSVNIDQPDIQLTLIEKLLQHFPRLENLIQNIIRLF